jgi:hypothetical protein
MGGKELNSPQQVLEIRSPPWNMRLYSLWDMVSGTTLRQQSGLRHHTFELSPYPVSPLHVEVHSHTAAD